MGLTANELSLEIGTGGSNPLASAVSRVMTVGNYAPVAQRIEHLTTDQKVRGSNPFGRTFGRSPASIRMWEIFLCAGVVAGGRNGRQWVISYTPLHGWVACVAAKKRLVMVGFAVVA